MRFLLALAAVVVGVSVIVTAQGQPKQFRVKPAPKARTAPKSTPAVKSPTATGTSATSKELQKVERQTPKARGEVRAPKKAPRTATLKPAKERPNPPINFGTKGGAGPTRRADPYKGRLKQKGTGRHY